MTLLALELKVPRMEEPSSAALFKALGTQWPAYFAFTTSFFTVLIMWVHHHRIMRTVHRADPALLFSNGLLLFLVTAVPFPTAIVAEYLRTDAAKAAAQFYGTFFFAISIAFYIFRSAATKRSVNPESMRALRRHYILGPPMYLLATISAAANPYVCLGICTALWIFWAFTTRER